MIKNFVRRKDLVSTIHPPSDVVKALKVLDSKLELHYDVDVDQWQFYRDKYGNDELYWQMSAPHKGTSITVGLVDWIKKYDTSQRQSFDIDQMQKNFRKQVTSMCTKNKKVHDSRVSEIERIKKDIDHHFISRKTGISVPITIGVDKKTGKPIRMVPPKPLRVLDAKFN